VIFTHVLAQATVSDLGAARHWYSALLDRGPDAEPMDGLLEWHLARGSGVQVWSESDRAGRSTVVLGVDDLDAVAARLTTAGLDHPGISAATSSRVLVLADPDGNRVVLTGT
jgi:predicted enzyme related to lactoylglutathione lyase